MDILTKIFVNSESYDDFVWQLTNNSSYSEEEAEEIYELFNQ